MLTLMRRLHQLSTNNSTYYLSIAIINHWCIRQLDVKNTFLHGLLKEIVFIEEPPSFAGPNFPNHVCHLKRALYGLKQAPRHGLIVYLYISLILVLLAAK